METKKNIDDETSESDNAACGTCTVEIVGHGQVIIHNERQWLCSPIPCPGCMERWKRTSKTLGAKLASKREQSVLRGIMATETTETTEIDNQIHNPDNIDCPINNPETFANPATCGLPCSCPEGVVEIGSENAIAGLWYETKKYGRVLCCGSTGPEFVSAFAVREKSGRTVMKYIFRAIMTQSPEQSW